jgi:ACS family pantothenate transporter-like MFS transporter
MSSALQEPRAGQQRQQQQQRSISAQGSVASSEITLTRWQKIENVIWDGGHRTPQERALVRRLDIFIMFVLPSTTVKEAIYCSPNG